MDEVKVPDLLWQVAEGVHHQGDVSVRGVRGAELALHILDPLAGYAAVYFQPLQYQGRRVRVDVDLGTRGGAGKDERIPETAELVF
jgi:hypothetical protein